MTTKKYSCSDYCNISGSPAYLDDSGKFCTDSCDYSYIGVGRNICVSDCGENAYPMSNYSSIYDTFGNMWWSTVECMCYIGYSSTPDGHCTNCSSKYIQDGMCVSSCDAGMYQLWDG